MGSRVIADAALSSRDDEPTLHNHQALHSSIATICSWDTCGSLRIWKQSYLAISAGKVLTIGFLVAAGSSGISQPSSRTRQPNRVFGSTGIWPKQANARRAF
jgi:hypothetical protein